MPSSRPSNTRNASRETWAHRGWSCINIWSKSGSRLSQGLPATVNSEQASEFCAEVAKEIAGSNEAVDLKPAPSMGAEDFSYMLQKKPGCYIWTGNGDTAGLHHPEYDFNDETIAVGASYWARLVEKRLPKSP